MRRPQELRNGDTKMIKMNEVRIAYDASAEDCKNLLGMLKCTIEKHSHGSRMEGVHWGHVGDINHLRQLLMEAQMSLNLDADTDEDEYMKDLAAELKTKRNA